MPQPARRVAALSLACGVAILSARAMGAESLSASPARLIPALNVETVEVAPAGSSAQALAFELGTTMHRDVAAWARLGFVDCTDDGHRLRCRDAFIAVVDQRYDEVDFRFDNRGRLIAVTARRVVDRPDLADDHLRRIREILDDQLGDPARRSSDASHHHRFGRTFATYQSPALTAEIVATNFCCRGTHIVERYRRAR